jgi:hypothetical protein
MNPALPVIRIRIVRAIAEKKAEKGLTARANLVKALDTRGE